MLQRYQQFGACVQIKQIVHSWAEFKASLSVCILP